MALTKAERTALLNSAEAASLLTISEIPKEGTDTMDNMVKMDVIGGMQGAYSMPGIGLCPINEL